MKVISFLIATYFTFCFDLKSQSIESSSTIEKNLLQLEFETIYSTEKEAFDRTTAWSIPNILVRFGLSKNLELQLHTPFTKEICYEDNVLISNIFDFDEVELGMAINLWKQKKIIPEASLMARIITSTNNIGINHIGNIISLNFSNSLSEKVSLNYNVGTVTDIDKNTNAYYILNLDYQPNPKVHLFIENTSDFNLENSASNCMSIGFGLGLKPNISLDFSASKSLKHKMFYTGVILTWVMDIRNKDLIN